MGEPARKLSHDLDPVWAAVLQSPVVSDPPTAAQLEALEEGDADIQAGRVIGHEDVHLAIQRMQPDEGE